MGVQARQVVAAGFALALQAASAAPGEAELPVVTVIAVTPVAGSGLALRDVPAAVQVFGERELARRSGMGLGEFLEAEAVSVSAQAAQGNRHQPDIRFRGFSASPLLGQAQGLSVFLDGVRINEPFGDVVNWDMVPTAALASVQLLPGSNPVFGRNTLGGALVLQTRNGHDFTGTEAEVSGGSFGQRNLQLAHGGASGRWDHFASLQLERERGAREHSGSQVRLGFARVGFHDGANEAHASLQLADNRLEGAQTLPLSWLDTPRIAYTWPDTTRNRLQAFGLGFKRRLDGELELSGQAHVRRHHSGNISSNVAGEDEDGPPATNDRSQIRQVSRGAALQLAADRRQAGVGHRWVIGASFEAATARYDQQTQPALFSDTRETVGTGAFEPVTDAQVRTRSLGVFALDTWTLSPRWTLTASGRYDSTRIRIDDRSGEAPELDGRHRFARLNPALGVNFHPAEGWNVFGGLSQGLRAPTSMELTCADPNAPCKLPTSFVSDPPLKAVLARTLELGVNRRANGSEFSATYFRSSLRDDIQFIASQGSTQAGYFQNVGRTLRQGVELAARVKHGAFTYSARYAWLDARFRTGFVERSAFNSSADAQGLIEVPAGARLPGAPRHQLKLRLEWRPDERWALGADAVAVSSSLSRGDENNSAAGSRVPGYALLHLDASYRVDDELELFAQVRNVFDHRYQTFGVLGRNAFAAGGARAEPFRGPGAPFGLWVGLRQRWR